MSPLLKQKVFFGKDTIHSQGESLVENENWNQFGLYGNVSTGATANPNSDPNQTIAIANPNSDPNPATASPNPDAGTNPNPATAGLNPPLVSNPATAGSNPPPVSLPRAESERGINWWIELSMDPENEQRQLIQSPLPQLGQSPENEVQISNSENFNSNSSNTGYRLPDRHNRGKPPKRFRPDEDGEGNYAISKFVTT